MPLTIVQADITTMDTDAIVNSANKNLMPGGGVCGAIFHAAGQAELLEECRTVAPCRTGQAVITSGYGLRARHIIHTVGPVWQGGECGEAELLAASYSSSLALAVDNGLESIAFPLISAGIFGYPVQGAIRIARESIARFLLDRDMDVYLVIFDREVFNQHTELLAPVRRYLGRVLKSTDLAKRSCGEKYPSRPGSPVLTDKLSLLYHDAGAYPHIESAAELDRCFEKMEESFSQAVLRLIAEKNMSEVETYKKDNIDRRLFSRIRSGHKYTPSKATSLALCIALELNLEETAALLKKAGYAISHSNKFDVIVEYFILERRYDIFEINEVLFSLGQGLLGAK